MIKVLRNCLSINKSRVVMMFIKIISGIITLWFNFAIEFMHINSTLFLI